MPSTPSHAGTAYEPLVPSPLNPRSCEGDALALRRRRNGCGSGKTARRSCTTAANMSPAQRLLRHKAAQAWRLQASRREALRIRQVRASRRPFSSQDGLTARGTGKIKVASPIPDSYPYEVDDGVSQVSPSGGTHDERQSSEPKQCGGQEREPRPPHYDYLLRMPGVGFFTPQRMVLAVGMKRMLPLVSPHDVLRSAKARREREEGRRHAELRMA